MSIRNVSRDERGIALPMALIVMVLLTTLMAAFAVLATSEPQIAGNQAASAQARALAESGVERAIWALSAVLRDPSLTDPALTIDANGNVSVSAPYDGSTPVSVGSLGQYRVTVWRDPLDPPNEMRVTAVGSVPNAVKKITVRVFRMKWLDPQCGLCAGGEAPPGTVTMVQVGGNATVNATASGAAHAPAGKFCAGVTPQTAVGSTGTVSTNGSPNLYSPTADPSKGGMDFTGHLLSDADMGWLKSVAKANGTYYQGSQDFSSPPPNGIIFVDTPSGNVLSANSPSSDLISVDVHGNWSSGWQGWLVVAGSFRMSGNVSLTGLVYAQNDVTLHGEGNGRINGAVISTNRVDTVSSTVDSDDIGNSPLIYDCPAVRSGGNMLNHWWVKPGTYQEVAGS
jgi:hypothetical protein